MDAQPYVGSELEIFQHATRWKAYFARTLRPFIVGDVLEVGAGLGGTSRFLCDGRQRSWTCLEPDRALLGQLEASLNARPLPSSGRALCGTVATLPADEYFDTILYVDVLEHIEDDRSELLRSASRLRPGGHVIVLAPAHQTLFSPFDKAIGHFRRYSKASLLAAAPPVLQSVESYYLDAAGMAASLANRLLLRASAPTHGQIRFWDRVLVPMSQVIDPVLAHTVGKSVVAIWTPGASEGERSARPAKAGHY
jgi:2-polyprenyl-3-methyl-5-hydroxy-6-metoxy-1,4-benzoquinol methylase